MSAIHVNPLKHGDITRVARLVPCTVIAVQEIGTSADDLRKLEAKKPKDKHREHKPHRPGPRDGNSDAARPL